MSISVTWQDNVPAAVTRFGYETDFVAINRVINPMGGKELITWQPQGHIVGTLTQNGYLPCVTGYQLLPGSDSPAITFRYHYSLETNFTGYPFNNRAPSQTEDNLHYREGNYDYWCSEILEDSQAIPLHTRTVTWNRFHLQISEIITENTCSITRVFYYPEVDGDFYAQPANIQIPLKIETTYAENNFSVVSRRTEFEAHESDEYGNSLRTVDITGIENVNIYYAATGETSCPADPFGRFVRYLKKNTQWPSGRKNETAKVTEYEYDRVSTNTSFSYMVVQKNQPLMPS